MSNEETVRYWGQTEAERQAAFQKDAAERAAAGWRVASQRTQFAFGKPGMDLVVGYVSDGAADTADLSDPADATATSTPPAPAHFDLSAAVAAATTLMPDHAPVPSIRATPASVAEAVAEAEAARASVPVSVPEPAVEAERPAEPEPEPEDEDKSAPSEPALDSPLTPEASRRLFGPNSDDVLWVLDSLADMDRATAEEIAAAYARADEALHAEATKALTDEFGGPPFGHRMKAAEDRVRAWVDAIGAQGNDRALYEAVGCAAMDAVDALIVQDQLVEDTFTVLYDPWGSVMDPPEADTPEEDGEASDETSSEEELDDHAADEEEPVEEEEAAEEDAAEYGPNTNLVIEFFAALKDVDPAQIDQLVERGTGEWQATLKASRDRSDEVESEKKRWVEQCDAAAREVDAWVGCRKGVHFDYQVGETAELDREAAAPAVLDAVVALVMADLLERDDAENLYSAWKYAVGTPALPEYVGDADQPDEADEADEAEPEGDFGPNTDVLLEFFGRLKSVTGRELAELGDPQPKDGRALNKAWDRALELAAEKPEWRHQFEAVTREVMYWRNRGNGLQFDYSSGAGESSEREQARPAVLRAAVALLFADLLERGLAGQLYAAWADAVGKPDLPEYSDG